MIRALGNISIRLWICALIGIPLAFFIISFLITVFPGLPALYAALLIQAILFMALGLVMDTIGKSLIASAVKEGEAWERAGILIKSERSYLKALRVYDTCLLSFFGSRKVTPHLTHVLARFILTSKQSHPDFTDAATVYLKDHPTDEDMALLWLKRLSKENKINETQEDVLSRIAQIHANSPRLLPLLTRFFIGLNRVDFPAQKVYQSALEDGTLKTHFESRINALVDREEEILASGRPLILFDPREEKAPVDIKGILTKSRHTLISAFKSLTGVLTSGISFVILSLCSLFTWIKQRDSVKFYLKASLLILAGILLLLLIINTISHLIPSPALTPEKPAVDIQIPKPFTIQVAAYLKETHADQYVERLKKQGLDAERKKVTGGGKEWFLVTVSEFSDKTSAAQYGRDLKNRGMIEDFFVTNRL